MWKYFCTIKEIGSYVFLTGTKDKNEKSRPMLDFTYNANNWVVDIPPKEKNEKSRANDCFKAPYLCAYVQTNELYQLASVAFWLLSSDKLGLSLDLGLFAAGVMISTTERLKRTVATLEKDNTHLKFEKNKLTVALEVANKSVSLNSNGVQEVGFL
ncbi:hypothetical protein L1887_04835 [Cichorium endivia]|nr:hypothetical protein L1887_04835 [Cichorium endivia]